MKSGTGDDPFAEEGGNDEEPKADAVEDRTAIDSLDDEPGADGVADVDDVVESIPNPGGDIPWRFRRDRVKGARDPVAQIVQLPETDGYYADAEAELASRFDADLKTLDAREAIFLAGMMNLDDAQAVLETWGYGYEK